MQAREGTLQRFLEGKGYNFQTFRNSGNLQRNSGQVKDIFEFLKGESLDQETKKTIYKALGQGPTINVTLAVQRIQEAEQGRIQGAVRLYPATITNQQPKKLDYFTDEFGNKHINRESRAEAKNENIQIFKDRNVTQNTLISNSQNGKYRLTKELEERQKEYELVYAFLQEEAKTQNTILDSVVFTSTNQINVTSINREEIKKKQKAYSGSDERYNTYIRYSVQAVKVQEKKKHQKETEIIRYYVNHFDGEVNSPMEHNKQGFALLVPPTNKVQGIKVNVGTLFRFVIFDRNVVHPPVNFNSDLVQPLSIFPIQPVEFNYSFSNEPILLNGMKVLFDNPTPTTSVTLQPKQRGTNNGR